MELLVSIKTPRLIRDRCGVYYFRLIVPLALRQFTGKAEFRRSLRTKDSLVARQRALSLSLAVESMMVSPKFLSNPSLADFPHLLRSDAKQGIREKIRIDLDKGIIETDTLEEAKEAQRITANLAKARQAVAAAGTIAVPDRIDFDAVARRAGTPPVPGRTAEPQAGGWSWHGAP